MTSSRILIVEDQIDIRRFIRMTLEMTEHELHEAGRRFPGAGAGA